MAFSNENKLSWLFPLFEKEVISSVDFPFELDRKRGEGHKFHFWKELGQFCDFWFVISDVGEEKCSVIVFVKREED